MTYAIRVIPFGLIATTTPADEPNGPRDLGLRLFQEPLLDAALISVRCNISTLSWVDNPIFNAPGRPHVLVRVPIYIGRSGSEPGVSKRRSERPISTTNSYI